MYNYVCPKRGMMKSLNINHLSGLKENMLITTSDKLTSLSVKFYVAKEVWPNGVSIL